MPTRRCSRRSWSAVTRRAPRLLASRVASDPAYARPSRQSRCVASVTQHRRRIASAYLDVSAAGRSDGDVDRLDETGEFERISRNGYACFSAAPPVRSAIVRRVLPRRSRSLLLQRQRHRDRGHRRGQGRSVVAYGQVVPRHRVAGLPVRRTTSSTGSAAFPARGRARTSSRAIARSATPSTRAASGRSKACRSTRSPEVGTAGTCADGDRPALPRVAPVRRLQPPLHDRPRDRRADGREGLGRRRRRDVRAAAAELGFRAAPSCMRRRAQRAPQSKSWHLVSDVLRSRCANRVRPLPIRASDPLERPPIRAHHRRLRRPGRLRARRAKARLQNSVQRGSRVGSHPARRGDLKIAEANAIARAEPVASQCAAVLSRVLHADRAGSRRRVGSRWPDSVRPFERPYPDRRRVGVARASAGRRSPSGTRYGSGVCRD